MHEKSVLLTLTPPKLTKQLREQAEKDIPVIDNAWGRRKEYKYNSYIKAKIEKGYLILSVFKTEFVRSGSKYPMYIVYFDRKKENTYHWKQKPVNGELQCWKILTQVFLVITLNIIFPKKMQRRSRNI